MANSQKVVKNLFSLADDQDVLDDFSCALRKKVFVQGRLFCTDNYLCFYANFLGFKTKQVIPYHQIISIKRRQGSLYHTIQISCTTNNKVFQFGMFNRRNEAFQFIFSLWRNSGYCDQQQDTGYWSDSQDPPPLQEQKQGIVMLPTQATGDVFQTIKAILPISPQKFFDLFYGEEAEFSLLDYCTERGDTQIDITPWGDNQELSAMSRELKFRTKIPGPSVGPKSTRCHRVQLYKHEGPNIIIKTSSKALDVPYSSYFIVEEEWTVSEISADKSMLRITLQINFLKSTVFSGQIVSRTKKDCTSDHENWLKQARMKCMNEGGSTAEKPQEKAAHQLAKYNQVDLKNHKAAPRSSGSQLNSLLVLNFICIIMLFFYLRSLSTRMVDIENRLALNQIIFKFDVC